MFDANTLTECSQNYWSWKATRDYEYIETGSVRINWFSDEYRLTVYTNNRRTVIKYQVSFPHNISAEALMAAADAIVDCAKQCLA